MQSGLHWIEAFTLLLRRHGNTPLVQRFDRQGSVILDAPNNDNVPAARLSTAEPSYSVQSVRNNESVHS
jgi:hypothetical protein